MRWSFQHVEGLIDFEKLIDLSHNYIVFDLKSNLDNKNITDINTSSTGKNDKRLLYNIYCEKWLVEQIKSYKEIEKIYKFSYESKPNNKHIITEKLTFLIQLYTQTIMSLNIFNFHYLRPRDKKDGINAFDLEKFEEILDDLPNKLLTYDLFKGGLDLLIQNSDKHFIITFDDGLQEQYQYSYNQIIKKK